MNKKQKGHRDREDLSTHSAVWEQSVSPDQTSKAEQKYTPTTPYP